MLPEINRFIVSTKLCDAYIRSRNTYTYRSLPSTVVHSYGERDIYVPHLNRSKSMPDISDCITYNLNTSLAGRQRDVMVVKAICYSEKWCSLLCTLFRFFGIC